MLFFIVLNAYDRPRDQSTMLVLDRDGLGYFAVCMNFFVIVSLTDL